MLRWSIKKVLPITYTFRKQTPTEQRIEQRSKGTLLGHTEDTLDSASTRSAGIENAGCPELDLEPRYMRWKTSAAKTQGAT